MRVIVRRVTKGDISRIRDIHDKCFADAKADCRQFKNFVDNPAYSFTVAMLDPSNRRVGYCIIEEYETVFNILELAVLEEFRRQGVGSRLLENVMGRLSSDGRRRVRAEVHEENLTSQLFFKHHHFKCVNSRKEDGSDVLLFTFKIGESCD